MTPVRLLLARHGETAWNRAGIYQGRSDPPLSPIGAAQARELGARLRRAGVGLIVSSPLCRAQDTALAVGDALGLPIRHDERLAEISFGAWEGMTQPDIKRRWPELLRQWKHAPAEMRFPGGETLVEARHRLRDFLRHPPWEDGNPPDVALVVTHAAIIRIARLEAEQRPLAAFREVNVAPASVYRCRLVVRRLLAAPEYQAASATADAPPAPE